MKKCENCGNVFYGNGRGLRRVQRFCSTSCAAQANWKPSVMQRRGYDAVYYHKLKPNPCEVCGDVLNVQAHHDDYDKPLEVRWLCRKHHQALHRK
jgi:ferredoxin